MVKVWVCGLGTDPNHNPGAHLHPRLLFCAEQQLQQCHRQAPPAALLHRLRRPHRLSLSQLVPQTTYTPPQLTSYTLHRVLTSLIFFAELLMSNSLYR